MSVHWLRGTKEQAEEHYKEWVKNLKKGKVTVSYHTGCYRNDYHEMAEICLMKNLDDGVKRVGITGQYENLWMKI